MLVRLQLVTAALADFATTRQLNVSLPVIVIAIFSAIHRRITRGYFSGMPLIPVSIQAVNVPKTLEMGIGHTRRTTGTQSEATFCRWIYFHLRSEIFFWPSYGGRSPPSPIAPLWTRHRDDHQCDVRTHLPRVACFAPGLSTPRIKDTYLRKKS